MSEESKELDVLDGALFRFATTSDAELAKRIDQALCN